MKTRDFHDHAWEFNRRHGFPGSVELVRKAMEFAYPFGVADATAEFRKAIDKVKETKEKSNQQR